MSTEKACRVCKELMAPDAKRCPRCQAWQSPWATFWFGGGTYSFAQQIIWIPVMLLVMWASFRFFMFPGGSDFEEHKDKLQFETHTMSFSKEKDREYVNVVGTIRNGTNIVWRDVHIEARFFNQKNVLIDTVSNSLRDVVIRPNAESAFRVSGSTIRPSPEYARASLTITAARSASWMDR